MQPNNPWQQPQYPNGVQPPQQPVQSNPQLPYFLQEDPGKPAPAAPHNKFRFMLIIAVLLVLLMGSVLVFARSNRQLAQSGPDALFTRALDNALSTKTYTVLQTKSNDQSALAVDASAVRNVKTVAKVYMTDGTLEDGYLGSATFKNSYIQYNRFANTYKGTEDGTLGGKWIQLRKNGSLPATYAGTADELYDPNLTVLNSFPMGNYSASQQRELRQYILAQKVFSYDTNKVTAGTIDGEPVTAYQVTTTHAKWTALQQKLGAIAGISAADITRAGSEAPFPASYTLYIGTSNGQIRRIQTKDADGTARTYDYISYDAAVNVPDFSNATEWDAFVVAEEKGAIWQLSEIGLCNGLATQFMAQ